MGIEASFIKGVNTIFKVLKEAVKDGTHVIITDDGFNDPTEQRYPVRVIFDKFTQADVQSLSFSELIQPTDVKCLLQGAELTVPIRTSAFIEAGGATYTVVAFDTDAFNVLYILLLRDT